MKNRTNCMIIAEKPLKVVLSLLLCLTVCLPSFGTIPSAFAKDVPVYSHGDVSLSSADADSNDVIRLEVGQSARISVSPYMHVQYQGCGMVNHCPENCELFTEPGSCFVVGKGCLCESDPMLRVARVVTSGYDASLLHVDGAVADEELIATEENLGKTVNGTVVLTGLAVGTTTVTVEAKTARNNAEDANGPLLEYWTPATKTYTVIVSADKSAYGNPESPVFKHGALGISSADADENDVITIKAGEATAITVSPYQHIQYKGCLKSGCPAGCEELHEGLECFVAGLGCKCDHAAVVRSANVSVTLSNPAVANVGDITAVDQLIHGTVIDTAYVTSDGTLLITGMKAGRTVLTVSAQVAPTGVGIAADDEYAETLRDWYPATKSYTLVVTDEENGFDLGITPPVESQSVATDMGKNPAGKVNFKLTPSEAAFAKYQVLHEGAAKKTMLEDWISSITRVTVGCKTLTGKAFDQWKEELTNAHDDAGTLKYYEITAGSSYATLKLPVALFNTDQEVSCKLFSIEATGFTTVTGMLHYRNLGSDGVVVRILDDEGTVTYSTYLTIDDMKKLTYQQHYKTSANCGMAGLRSYDSEGILLMDLLDAAGVEFSQGMTLKLRLNDSLETNGGPDTVESGYEPGGSNGVFTYEKLMGSARYYWPLAWDNTTTYEELGGATIYSFLSKDRFAWKSGANASTLKTLMSTEKYECQPILAWAWNEGVVAWGGTNPAEKASYNGYSDQQTLRFLYGMKADDQGVITDDNTTFDNMYAVFGIDIVGGKRKDVEPLVNKGDVNNSGVVTIVDAQLCYDLGANVFGSDWKDIVACFGEEATKADVVRVSDVNGDGAVDATDALAIQNYIHRKVWG